MRRFSTFNRVLGGGFKEGFLSAAFTKFGNLKLRFQRFELNIVKSAIIGGGAAVLGGGKFINGARTAAFAALFSGVVQQQSSGLARRVLNVVGKIWALPNTLIGLAYGGVGTLFGATPVWGSQAGILRFTSMPGWMMPSAMSFGHVQVFGPGSYRNPDGTFALNRFGVPVVTEETLHTRQAEILGPFYLPLHAIGMGSSILTGGGTHNNNLLEQGPERGISPWP